jgi:hypothetical protein
VAYHGRLVAYHGRLGEHECTRGSGHPLHPPNYVCGEQLIKINSSRNLPVPADCKSRTGPETTTARDKTTQEAPIAAFCGRANFDIVQISSGHYVHTVITDKQRNFAVRPFRSLSAKSGEGASLAMHLHGLAAAGVRVMIAPWVPRPTEPSSLPDCSL